MNKILRLYGLIVSLVCTGLMGLVFLAQIFQGYYYFYEYNQAIAFFELCLVIITVVILIKIIDEEIEDYLDKEFLKEVSNEDL